MFQCVFDGYKPMDMLLEIPILKAWSRVFILLRRHEMVGVLLDLSGLGSNLSHEVVGRWNV